MKVLFSSLLIILICICCIDKKENIYIGDMRYISSFKDTLYLDGKPVEIDNLGAMTIDVVDTFFVFVGSQWDNFYQVYSKYSCQRVGSFVPKGRGRNELPTVGFPIFCTGKGNNAVVWLHDRASNSVKMLNLSQSVTQRRTVFEEDWIEIKHVPGFKYLYPINDSILFLHGWNMALRNDYYALYHISDENITILDTIYRSGLQDPGDMFLFNAFAGFHLKKQKYATAMQFFNQINIYSLDKEYGKNIALTVGTDVNRLKDVEETAMPDKFEFYEDMVCTDSLLFAIYANKSRKDWAMMDTLPVDIHVFDWEGNPICLLHVKEKLAKLAIDEEEGILYGMTLGEKVYKYDLTGVIN